MLVSDFLSENGIMQKKSVTSVTVTANPSICKENAVTEAKTDFCYRKLESLENKSIQAKNAISVTAVTANKKSVTAETVENKGVEPCGNRSNNGNSKKTQNQFSSFDGENWLCRFEERAAIYEYENGDSKNEAEIKAFNDCIIKWHEVYPQDDLNKAVETLLSYGLHDCLYKKEYYQTIKREQKI